MNNKEQFYHYKEAGLFPDLTEEIRVKLLTDDLLQCLYKPSLKGNILFIPDWSKIKRMGIDSSEPVNWADLKSTVEKKEGYYLITIDEASPGDCQTLCDYIYKYISSWGWNVQVETEW
jgi:hypothetical protein